MPLLRELLGDASFYFERPINGLSGIVRSFLSPPVVAVFLARRCTSHRLVVRSLARWLLIVLFSCDVSPGVSFGKSLRFPHPIGLVIGNGVVIGPRATIYQNATLGRSKNGRYPRLGSDVTIFAGAVVIGAVELDDHMVVGANAVVGRAIR